VPLARALVAGGVCTLEITLRTSAAVEAAKAVIAEVPDAIVGIGTVLSVADFERSHQLGAHFTVSPGATRELLDAAASSDLPLLPGVATASELMLARERGFDTLKFFPAEQAGGIAMLRAWAGPFPDVRFCPTGGISAANAAEWLSEPTVLAVGGSWLSPSSAVKSGDWAGITAMCARTMKALSQG
jgi:2-dehydro-3-deoxyphosphogluconate aldolase/(4S)-4-hydroxy-2-oxoglutarate aldolase